jgi:hypothetical protein
MFGFFDKGITWNKGMQLFNAAAFTLALYNLATDPEAHAAELGLDLVTHAYSLWCLNDNPSFGNQIGGYSINVLRVGDIYRGIVSGVTSVPLLINAADAVGHLLTAGSILFNGSSDKDDNKQTTAPTPM